jgi:hypothetical protein
MLGRAAPSCVWFALAMAGVLSPGCGERHSAAHPGAGGDDAPPPAAMTAASRDSLRLTLELPAEAAGGEEIPITFRVANVSGAPLDLYLQGREITFDVIVADAAGDTVWNRLHERIVPAILRLETLAADASLELTHTWDQRSNDGTRVAPGNYRVHAALLTETRPLVTDTARLRIGG